MPSKQNCKVMSENGDYNNLLPSKQLGRVVRREQSSLVAIEPKKIRTICVVRPVKVVRSIAIELTFAPPQINKR